MPRYDVRVYDSADQERRADALEAADDRAIIAAVDRSLTGTGPGFMVDVWCDDRLVYRRWRYNPEP
jgi:hypothetical protein